MESKLLDRLEGLGFEAQARGFYRAGMSVGVSTGIWIGILIGVCAEAAVVWFAWSLVN